MSAFVPVPRFFFFACVAGTSSTMLNKSGESGNPCVVPDLRGNTLRVSPLRMMTASPVGALLQLSVFPLYSLQSFYHKWMLNSVKTFFFIT